jgi:predicted transcriptional regulator
MAKNDFLSVRLSPELNARLMDVIQATGGEVTKTAIVERSINAFLRLLELEPSIIPEYDPDAHLSVTQRKGV